MPRARDAPGARSAGAAIGPVRGALLVALAAALLTAAHPPFGLWPLGLVVLAPLAFFAEGTRPAALLAFAWAAMWLGTLLTAPWLVHALVSGYGVAPLPAWTFTVTVVALYALPGAALLSLYARLRPRARAAAAPLLFAALAVANEWLRAVPLGCPWLLSAHPLAAAPLFVQTAELGGAHLPGFVAAATGGGLGIALARRRLAPLTAPAALLALALGFGLLRLSGAEGATSAGEALRVGVVQASVPQAQRFRPDSAHRNLLRHVEATRALVASGALDLVVWSETAVDADLDRTPGLAGALTALADATGVPLVTGAPRSEDGRSTNSVVVVVPGAGIAGSYAKQRLVPLAEADSSWFGVLAPLVAPLVEGTGYAAGTEPTLLRAAGAALATPVCFEITYPDLMRGFRAAGAELIVNVSNDAWFGERGYPEMHLAHARLRAVELRSFVVRGANTGISAVIDPFGRVVERLPAFEEGQLRAEVRATRAQTLYARFGDAPLLVLLGAVALATTLGPGAAGSRGRSAARDRRAPRAAARGRAVRSRATPPAA